MNKVEILREILLSIMGVPKEFRDEGQELVREIYNYKNTVDILQRMLEEIDNYGITQVNEAFDPIKVISKEDNISALSVTSYLKGAMLDGTIHFEFQYVHSMANKYIRVGKFEVEGYSMLNDIDVPCNISGYMILDNQRFGSIFSLSVIEGDNSSILIPELPEEGRYSARVKFTVPIEHIPAVTFE